MDASIGEHAQPVFQLTYTPAYGTGDPHAPCAFLALSQQALAQQEIDSPQRCRRCARVVGIHSLKQSLCPSENNEVKRDVDLEQELDTLTYAVQRDWLLLRLARMHGLPHEEKRKRCLEQLEKLHLLLTEMTTFLKGT